MSVVVCGSRDNLQSDQDRRAFPQAFAGLERRDSPPGLGSSREACPDRLRKSIPVGPRDLTWEDASPRYRVHFFAGSTSDEYEISEAPDVGAVLAWAEADPDARPYV